MFRVKESLNTTPHALRAVIMVATPQIPDKETIANTPLEEICQYAERKGPDFGVRANYVICKNGAGIDQYGLHCCVATTIFWEGHAKKDASVRKQDMYECPARSAPAYKP